MSNFILFLSTADIPACQMPFVLQIIYFGKLLFNIVQILLPICLIIYMLIDFSKCVINGDEASQSKIVKLSFKRMLYAILIYLVPYIVSITMSIISTMVPDYNLCITNATPENIETFVAQYEDALEKEETKKKEAWAQNLSNKFVPPNYISSDFYNSETNLKQCGAASSWANYPISCAQNRSDATICTSGCGYVAYTMVVRDFGYVDVTPDQIVDIACNEANHKTSAASSELLTGDVLNKKFGLSARYINESQIEDSLKNGDSLIILIPGHWISILGINSDNTLIVGDSYFKQFGSNGVYTVDTLKKATTADFRSPYKWSAILAYSKK